MANENENAVAEGPPYDQTEQFRHLGIAGQEALTDEMVGRLAETASETMDLLDRLNRSRLDEALPILERMTATGDLQRLADLARLVGAGQEAVTDEMVSRLAETSSETLNLLEKLQRSEVENALPVLDRMVRSGDLERMANLARLVGSAQEAMTDEMVGRLAGSLGEGLALLDRLSTTGVLDRLVDAAPALERLMSHLSPETIDNMAAELPRMVQLLEDMSQAHLMEDMLKCVSGAAEEAQHLPEAKGGVSGLWSIMKQKETQDLLQFVVLLGKNFKECRIQRNGGD